MAWVVHGLYNRSSVNVQKGGKIKGRQGMKLSMDNFDRFGCISNDAPVQLCTDMLLIKLTLKSEVKN